MLSLPHELTQYWLTYSLADRSPAYFRVTGDGKLIRWGGAVEYYDQPTLTEGQFMGECFPFLAHSFPMQHVTEFMQWIETDSGLILDAHFHFQASDGWILFVASGDEAQKIQSLMQQGNELKLLRRKYDKVVQRQMERDQSSLIFESLLELSSETKSTSISILQIRLNLYYSSPETSVETSICDPLEQLNLQLKAIFKAAIEEGGLIHHVFGQTVAILFGLLPSPLASAQQAIQTARQLLVDVQAPSPLNPSFSDQGSKMTMGMGITTGRLDIDIRPVKNRKIFHLIGQTIVRAEEMLLMLTPGFLLIDQNSFNLADSYQSEFSPWSPHEPIASCKTPIYAQPLNE